MFQRETVNHVRNVYATSFERFFRNVCEWLETVYSVGMAQTPLPPIAQIGTPATRCVGSDSYPYIVVSKSPTGKKLGVKRLECQIVSGSFMSGDAVVEYWLDPSAPVDYAYLSKRGYLLHGSPLSLRGARFYQAPEF